MLSPAQKIFLTKLKWYVREKVSSVWDCLLYTLKADGRSVPAASEKASGGKKNLVFVGEQLPPRIPRMAKWIRREGNWIPWIVGHGKGYFPEFTDPCFENVFLFRNKWHLKRILRKFKKIDILHGFAPKSYFCNIARKAVNTPYVHDMQDVYSIYYGDDHGLKWLEAELPEEKDALETCNGLVAHSLEPNAAYRKLKTKKKPLNLFFPLCCDEDRFSDNMKDAKEEIHIAYAGGVAGKHRNPRQYGNTQFHELISILGKQNIHFHLYPAPSGQKADYEEYEALSKTIPTFHFHKPVSQEKLAGELAKYHFGILPFFKERTEQSDAKLKYATTLKLFNYFEAGIPVIVSKDLGFQSWVVHRYRAGYAISMNDLQNLSKVIRQVPYRELAGRVALGRKQLSLKEACERLLGFYNRLNP